MMPPDKPQPKKAPAAQPPEGRQLRLRAPTSKAEKRLVAKLQRACKGRDQAMRQYIGCCRAVERAAEELEKAGMVVDPPAPPKAAELPLSDAGEE